TEIKWSDIALNDDKALAVFADGRTEAVFQFESSGMQEICRKLKPKGLEDLAALNALYRPGPLDGGMVDEFILRHHGKKAVRYIVPEMKDILSNTYGIIVYQEQIMQLAQKLAGYTLSEADLMRRAMGKKKREEMAVHEEKFITGAVERGIKQEKAEKIFSLMAQFSDYGFNRSHSVAYAYLAFQTAYLKAHFPEHFYAAVLSSEAQDAAKVFKYSKELRAQKIALLPPDVNESNSGFTPLSGAIRYGLTAIKGLGQAIVKAICEARDGGPFRSFFDFAERVESNKRVFESLVSAGAFDSLRDGRSVHEWRGALFNSIDVALSQAQRSKRERAVGQSGLFGGMPEEIDFTKEISPTLKGWTPTEMLAAEKAALGFYISGHPLERYLEVLQNVKAVSSSELPNVTTGTRVTSGGIITDLQTRTTKKGDKFALLRLEDEAGGTKCVLWPEVYRKHTALLQNDLAVVIIGRLELSEDNPPTIIVDQVQSIDAASRSGEFLVLRTPQGDDFPTLCDEILGLLSSNPGDCDVTFEALIDNGTIVRVRANPALRVKRSSELEEALKKLGCRVSVENPANGNGNGARV
ncbi:MAG TPA: DNA polymerase III subunit alpha, partial [Pyrinomonadaceae bacterium]|nr:DNA polymerase III subunit alpha [Pyrinomonadaceae bacterium]